MKQKGNFPIEFTWLWRSQHQSETKNLNIIYHSEVERISQKCKNLIFFFLAPLRLLRGLIFWEMGKACRRLSADTDCLMFMTSRAKGSQQEWHRPFRTLEAGGVYLPAGTVRWPRWSLQQACHMSGTLSFRISRNFEEMCHGSKSEVSPTLKLKAIHGTPQALQQQVFLPKVYGSCRTPVNYP